MAFCKAQNISRSARPLRCSWVRTAPAASSGGLQSRERWPRTTRSIFPGNNCSITVLGAGAKHSPVFMFAQPEATNGLGGLGVAINWDGKLPAKHFQTANVIAMFMGQKQSIQLFGRHAALFEPDDDLARAQPAIDQNP